jgi:uncharacterized protein YihD (DUF1040 family)
MVASFFTIFCGVYLLVEMLSIIEDYLRERKLIHHLNRIESKVDQLPGVDKDKEDEWWTAIR